MFNKVAGSIRQNERGTTLVMVTFWIVALFGFVSLSIDVSHVFQEQRREQIAADAASYAAAVLLTNSPQVKLDIIQAAKDMALTNGLTDAEIANSSLANVQVGRWNPATTNFTADATPYNAVRVPGRRTVPLSFSKIVGLGTIFPAVDSITAIGNPTTVSSPIPYGFAQATIAGKHFGDLITIVGPDSGGNWGKLDIGGKANGHFGELMDKSLAGTNDDVSVGDMVSPGTGNAHLSDTLDNAIGQIVAVPIVDQFNNGNHDSQIVGFVLAKVISAGGSGGGATVVFQLVPGLVGTGFGGPGGVPFTADRVLVK